MKNKTISTAAVFLAIGLAAGQVRAADESCWKPDELKAYDITMQTLMLAHVAAACDGVVHADPPLRNQFAAFLGKNGPQMQADRSHLNAFYQRAYGSDWQGPLQKSLAREDKRVTTEVSQGVSPDTCNGAAQLIQGLGNAQWSDFVADASAQHWHERAGFPACEAGDK